MNARRAKPRRITVDSEEEDTGASPVIRPPKKKPPTTTTKSKTRLSFAPTPLDGENEGEPVFVQKKSRLSKAATERAQRRAPTLEGTPTQERVNYSAEYLAALKAEQNAAAPEEDVQLEEGDVLAIVDEEGGGDVIMPDAASAIPDQGLVRHLKARRAEMKGKPAPNDEEEIEEDFISLAVGGRGRKEGRLEVGDDEPDASFIEEQDRPILENTRRARGEAERRRRERIQEAIEMSESESDGEDFVEEQVRAGGGGGRKGLEEVLAETPAMGKVPGLGEVVGRLEELLRETEGRRRGVEKVLGGVRDEKREIGEREGVLKERLKEAGVAYERLRGEMGLGGMQEEEPGVVKMRGLESFGGTPVRGGDD